MDWSATLSLTTSQSRTHRANYGSFSSAAPLKRNGSGSTISIPESIPEHQCVVQFESPQMKHGDVQILECYDVYSASYSSRSSNSTGTTLTITTEKTESTRLNTFKMLLTSPNRINGGSATSHMSARAASDDDVEGSSAPAASSYWQQERERMRLLRERRYLTRNGSPTKAATLRDEDDPETSKYRTAVIMCSVPLLLVIVFVVFVLVFGDGSVAAVGAPANVLSADAQAAPLAPAMTHFLRSAQHAMPAESNP